MAAISSDNVKKRTVKVLLPRSDSTYLRDDFAEAFDTKGISVSSVEAIGPIKSNSTWQITFKTQEQADAFCTLQYLEVCGKRGRVVPVVESVVRIRVHWLPYYVPHAAVKQELARFGECLGAEFETSDKSRFGPVRTGVRILALKLKPGLSVTDLPYGADLLNFNGEELWFLSTVSGRPPKCFRCQAIGHVSKECSAERCRECREYGHETDSCPFSRPSFAGIVRGARISRQPESDESDDERLVIDLEREGEGSKRKEETVEKVVESEERDGAEAVVEESDRGKGEEEQSVEVEEVTVVKETAEEVVSVEREAVEEESTEKEVVDESEESDGSQGSEVEMEDDSEAQSQSLLAPTKKRKLQRGKSKKKAKRPLVFK